MNLETVTIQDCLDNYNFKGQITVLNDGKVKEFKEEKKNPHTDR